MRKAMFHGLIFALSLPLVACNLTEPNSFAKTFSKNGFQITLTEEFTEMEYEGCDACFASVTISLLLGNKARQNTNFYEQVR